MNNTTYKIFAFFAEAFAFLLLASCSVQRQLSKKAHETILDSKELVSANVGISVFDPSNNTFLYGYNDEKYFTPASNTKLFTLYAGLKYLGDSLVAARYIEERNTIMLQATGDPTFLHPDFKNQPLLTFLQGKSEKRISIYTPFASESFGAGWSWEDYKYEYMAERDPFPMYGNMATVLLTGDSITTVPPVLKPFVIGTPSATHRWQVKRELGGHIFTIDTTAGSIGIEKKTTMAMGKGLFASRYLSDTLHREVTTGYDPISSSEGKVIYSQPKDSLFTIMMHRSDNFFAEQTLLMAANEKLGEMNDEAMLDTLLATDFKDLPQKPQWVDGSGLSRYNLFSPRDFVWLLDKLKNEYGLNRLKIILPGADQGTLEGLYKGYDQRIFAKTGSLSNNLALSGYLITRKNKTLLFSIMVNNHIASTRAIRKHFEQFLTGIIDKY